MSYFADLTPHTYTPTGGLPLLNVGWLDSNQHYPEGKVSQVFLEALHLLCQNPTHLHRGFHVCQFCMTERGNGQVRVKGKDGTWYSAPTMIEHYVIKHSYRPPSQFVDAVLGAVDTGDGR